MECRGAGSRRGIFAGLNGAGVLVDELALSLLFAQSIAIGALIGFERERHPGNRAGLRTFMLIALAGTLFAALGELVETPWLPASAVLAIGAMMIAAHYRGADADADSGTTSVVAALITLGLGMLLWYGHAALATAVAIVMMALLYFRAELHGVAHQLTQRDYVSFLQFAVLAFVLLPLLPDRTYDTYDALNPYRIGWMVVLISGVSLAGYVALRVFGERRGWMMAGLFGGLASTVATTLAFARRVRRDRGAVALSASVILLANLVLYARIGLFVAVIAPALLPVLAPVLAGGLLAGCAFAGWYVYRLRPLGADGGAMEIGNPVELRVALGFALLLAVVLFGVAWINARIGAGGVYAGAFLAGLTDLDAITLSTLRLANADQLLAWQATIALTIAFLANFCFKAALAAFAGSLRLARPVALGFAAMALGMAVGLLAVAPR
jgi:uncharacterized membrane protein (DUF4010 family)